MNTIENNKLIAEFMGYEFIETTSEASDKLKFISLMYDNTKIAFTYYRNEEEKQRHLESEIYKYIPSFNKDWNWLMQVVEKIYSTVESITEEQNSEWDMLTRNIRDSFYFPKIEAVYNACITFIEWYNQQKVKRLFNFLFHVEH